MISFQEFLSEQLLIEAKIDIYKDQEKKIPTDHDENAQFKKPGDIIDHFHSFVPGGNVDHTRWVVNRYKNGELKQEDAPGMKDTLDAFNKYKDRLPRKNINQYKSVEDLRTSLHPFTDKEEAKRRISQEKIAKGSTLIHDTDKVKMWHVHNMEASQELGHRSWCTANPDPEYNRFDDYNDSSGKRAYYLHLPKEEYPYRKIGVFVGTGEFQDETNEYGGIPHDKLEELVKRNPELKKIPELQGVRVATTQDHDKHFYDLVRNDEKNAEHLKNVSDETIKKAEESNDNNVSSVARTIAKGKVLDDIFDSTTNRGKQLILENNPNIQPHHIDHAIDNGDTGLLVAAAAHPSASPEQLKKYLLKIQNKKFESRDLGRNYKLVVAAHRNATPEMLERLYKEDNGERQDAIENTLIRNPNTPNHIISDFVEKNKDNYYKLKNVVHNNALSSDQIHHLIATNDSDIVTDLIKNHPSVTKEHLMSALDNPKMETKIESLKHRDSDNDVAQKGLLSNNQFIRGIAASHPSHTPDQIDKLLDSKDFHIRRGTTNNPNASPANITKALGDEHRDVAANVLYRKDLTPEHIKHVLKSDKFDEWQKKHVAGNKNIDDEGRSMALNQGHYDSEEIAKFHPDFITKHLTSTNPEDYKGAAKLAAHITEPKHLNIAVNHPDPAVRANLITFNKNIPPDIVTRMKSDPHPLIRQLANT